jgi:hypothetical protein
MTIRTSSAGIGWGMKVTIELMLLAKKGFHLLLLYDGCLG